VLHLFFTKKLFLPKVKLPSKDKDLIPATRELMSAEFKKRLQDSADILESEIGISGITLFSISTLIDKTMLHQDIIDPIKNKSFDSVQKIKEHLSIGEMEESTQMEKVVNSALDGNVIIYLEGNSSVLLVKIPPKLGVLSRLLKMNPWLLVHRWLSPKA
jgi:Bacillus/Clostridium GerA spore germination protein